MKLCLLVYFDAVLLVFTVLLVLCLSVFLLCFLFFLFLLLVILILTSVDHCCEVITFALLSIMYLFYMVSTVWICWFHVTVRNRCISIICFAIKWEHVYFIANIELSFFVKKKMSAVLPRCTKPCQNSHFLSD